jgi:hypothetical protein
MANRFGKIEALKELNDLGHGHTGEEVRDVYYHEILPPRMLLAIVEDALALDEANDIRRHLLARQNMVIDPPLDDLQEPPRRLDLACSPALLGSLEKAVVTLGEEAHGRYQFIGDAKEIGETGRVHQRRESPLPKASCQTRSAVIPR